MVTKLCWSSDGDWREVREVGMGEAGETVAAVECCSDSENRLEILLMPEVWLALSGKITGGYKGRKKKKMSDEGLKTQSKTEATNQFKCLCVREAHG